MKTSPSDSRPVERLVIIDAANTLYRAFFALPPLRTADGIPTNAAYGFVNMLNKVVREESPDALVVVFDAPGKSFRHALFPGYKATRDAQPEDLSVQWPLTKELIDAYRVAVLEVPEVEADDVIASLVADAPPDVRITIVSTDKDLMQLVSERVCLLDTMKDRRFGPEEVEARFGVPPESVLDVRALVGDPSDNIPGVRGIGEKGAAALIREWGDLENLLAHAAEVKGKRNREALESQAEEARLSKRLATLRTDLPLSVGVADLRCQEPDRQALRELFQRLGFTRLLEGLEVGAPEGEEKPQTVADAATRVIADAPGLESLMKALRKQGSLAWLAVGPAQSPVGDPPAGLAFATGETEAAYVVLRPGPQGTGLAAADVVGALAPLMPPGGTQPWVATDAKRLAGLLAESGAELGGVGFDAEIAAFLLDPAAQRRLPMLAAQYLGRSLRSWEDLAGRGAKAKAAGEIAVETLAAWAGEQVCALAALAPLLADRLEAEGLQPLFEDVEMPLTAVLARMEHAGVRVDEEALTRLSHEYQEQLERIEAEIYALAGERFLISSPKQLQVILFEKLGLPVVRKTKTGYSTDEAVLEQLAQQHELPARILAHRHLAKLKNTYVDALPPLIHPQTGRIHPTFHQTGAATGRLSAANPNVQNIPIRSEEGVRIREAFIPAEGTSLLSADYSQVELRILAHYSEDPSLIEAFASGEDIHRRTAAEVSGIAPEDVSDEQRSRAKAINFGIIYGSTAFGISNQLGIASSEAQATIDAYFERYQGVRRFLDQTVESAREQGFVRTLLGRRRYLPDLASRNRVLRNAAERMATNSVIQGTAADFIKRAMVQVDRGLRAGRFAARMILQVHDELVLEVPGAEIEGVRELVCKEMQEVWPLRVPLVVDVGVGSNWREAH